MALPPSSGAPLGREPSAQQTAPRPLVSVIIINYNGLRYLQELIDSILAQTLSDYEVVFVDNASSDESLSFVHARCPDWRVIAQSENTGFSRAGNLACQRAEGEFLAFLNTDIKLHPAWLQEVVAAAQADTTVAAVACKLLLYHDPTKLNGVGGMMNRLGYTWDRGMFEVDRGQYDEPSEVLFASAGAALFRRSLFLHAGGFDERFFMYHEDVDLCWRLWVLGYRIVTAPGAVALHHFGGSTRESKSTDWRELMGERHSIRSLIKNYQPARLGRALLALLLRPQPRKRKLGQAVNLLWNCRVLVSTLAARRRISRLRVKTDQQLAHLIIESNDVPISL